MFSLANLLKRTGASTHYRPLPVHWLDTTPVKSTDVPCTLSALDVQVRVSGLYADVTQTLRIANPNPRDLSVGIALPMPDRAVVCGYALEIDGQMIDGVVVPKEEARVVFETEQRRGADPGLVEAVKGNVYRTRVYPVPAHGSRSVRLRYVTPLLLTPEGGALLDAPMPDERVGERTIRIDVELLDCPVPQITGISGAQFTERGTFWSIEAHDADVEPNGPVRVALPALPASFSLVERDADGALWFAASEQVPPPAGDGVPAMTTFTVLWDTSGSRANVDHAAELALLRAYCAGATVGAYRLIAFSDTVEDVCVCTTAKELVARIGELRYDGGSDFRALAQALAHDGAAADEGAAYVLFTDGMDTLSGEALSFPSECCVLAVVSGADRDAEALRQACGGRAFDLAAAPKDAAALARALFRPTALAQVDGAGFADVLGIGSGADGRYAVVGRLTAENAVATFSNTGTAFGLNAADAREGGVIARAWAAMRVAQLAPRADESADELLDLGKRFGIASPATSLLVLETLDQWLRYDIEPPATWEPMHRDWVQTRSGRMQLTSEQGLKNEHLRELKRNWAELLTWWRRDFSIVEPTGVNVMGFCPACGASVVEGARFCHVCGELLPPMQCQSGVSAGMRMPLRTMGAPRPGDFGAPVSRAMASMPVEDGMPFEGSMMMDREMAAAPGAAFGAAPMMAFAGAADEGALDEADIGAAAGPSSATVKVQPWMPDAAYLTALDEALAHDVEAARGAYFQQRAQHAAAPSFYIDCAGWFMAHDDVAFGLRVLTNLAELRIEDAALLRVMAWRLREAGERARALVVLRRVLKLRPEDSQSHRDVALVLDELAREAYGDGDEAAARALAEEAGSIYREIALTPWQRRPQAIALFAVEEYNVLRAWADAQTWETAPELASLGADLEGVLECDVRITLAWDADETDVDLHVTEPGGEEAYYGHRLTAAGGRVSEDITDGYGPELYEIHRAQDGVYAIRAHYYASHQQTVFGPASCTLTIYTDWGRPTQTQRITSTRLENAKEMIAVGSITYGDGAN